MAGIQEIISGVIEREGAEYTNDPHDPGGPTKYGITQISYSEFLGRPASVDEIKNLTPEQARSVYLKKYVTAPSFDKIAVISQPIAEELVDSGVNCGTEVAGRWLQRCLNALNREGKDYSDLEVDGHCGPITRGCLEAYLHKRGKEGELVLWRYLNALQGAYYISIAEQKDTFEDYVYGWGLNRLGGHY